HTMRRFIRPWHLLAAFLMAIALNITFTFMEKPIGASMPWLQWHTLEREPFSIVPESLLHLVSHESRIRRVRSINQTTWIGGPTLIGQPPHALYDLWQSPGYTVMVVRTQYGTPLPTRTVRSVDDGYLTVCYIELSNQIDWRPSFIHDASPQPFRAPTETAFHAAGFVLNPIIITAFLYPALLALSKLTLLFTHRRRRRERLGLCLNCAYDIRGLSRCPECGLMRDRPDALNETA
ncbi:MAG: hypothetical protein ACF8LL_10920, partial [Phycisphaerales bacterium]